MEIEHRHSFSEPDINDGDSRRSSIIGQTRRLSQVSRPSISGSKFQYFGRRVARTVGVTSRFRRFSKISSSDPQEDEERDSGIFRNKPHVKEDFINYIDINHLPRINRFSSCLSPEGQWVLLRGYDDLLVKTINKYLTKMEENNNSYLKGISTPNIPDMKTNYVDFARNPKVVIQTSSFGKSAAKGQVHRESVSATPKPPDSYRTPPNLDFQLSQLFEQGTSRLDTGIASSPNRRVSTGPSIQPLSNRTGMIKLPPVERQPISSYRVENAADILDYINHEIENQTVLSERYKRHGTIEPVDHYRLWSETWQKEFEFKPRETIVSS